ncbi:hypothetical protein [Planctomycetes bacterium TBK1r]|uniref:Uncharacterized protein n=1 Tax=Stieleria magnilauensis TaxID=2527963 RepID=A0ABX5Y4E4_9BACT|nr:hypothetical protein TBK1r_68880 [Planctomycetes bacterium TBK1r]
MDDSKSRTRAFRYSIATILFLAACVAGMLAGYRAGFSTGYSSGIEERRSELPMVTIYEFDKIFSESQLTQSQLNDAGVGRLDLVVMAIETTIEPDTWEALGGEGTIRPMGENAIAVKQRPYVHEQISEFFTNPDVAIKLIGYALQEFQRMAAFRASGPPMGMGMGMGMGTMEASPGSDMDNDGGEQSDAHESPSQVQ